MNKYLLKRSLIIGIPSIAAIGVIVGVVVVMIDKNKASDENAKPGLDQNHDSLQGNEDIPGETTDSGHQEDPLAEIIIGEDTSTSDYTPGVSPSSQIYDPFPTLSSYDFYDYIRVNENGPYFSDDFIAAVVNKVIKEAVITDGTIHFSYERVSQSVLKITFVWVNSNHNIYPKVYTFTLSNGR